MFAKILFTNTHHPTPNTQIPRAKILNNCEKSKYFPTKKVDGKIPPTFYCIEISSYDLKLHLVIERVIEILWLMSLVILIATLWTWTTLTALWTRTTLTTLWTWTTLTLYEVSRLLNENTMRELILTSLGSISRSLT